MLDELSHCLSQIKDITDNFTPIPAINENETNDIYESVLLLIDEYLNENILQMQMPNFHSMIYDEIYNILYIQYNHLNINDKFDNELYDIIIGALNDYFTNIIPKRSYHNTFIRKHKTKNKL